jgi:succinyl-diaminopimelate desuccinylase
VSGELFELARELVEVPSVTGGEKAICDLVEARLSAKGGGEVRRNGDSLLCVPRPIDGGKRTVALLGHLDTVPEPREPQAVRVEDGRLFGLGASDMKAADALIVLLAEEALRRETRHNLVCVLYAGEEGPFASSGLPGLMEACRDVFERIDFAVCMEPTANAVELGCLGTLHATVRFHGKAAHSARPWQGENAIQKAAPLLSRLASFGRRECVVAGLSFSEVMNATIAKSHGARNVIPALFEVNVNYRFAPGKDAERAQREVMEIVGGEAEVEFVDVCPSGAVCADHPLLAELDSAAGGVLPRGAKQAWTDVGRLSAAGIAAVNFGPGDPARAHQAQEWISLADLERSHEITRRWLFP